MHKVLFDTDIGIDDAMALLFLHCSDAVEVKGIITGFGNASLDQTTRNAFFLKQKFGIATPVFRGAKAPVAVSPLTTYPDFVHGKNGLGDISIPTIDVPSSGLDGPQAICDLVQKYPHELTLVCVGRLTNLALALEICPSLPDLVKQLIVMGGAFGFNGHQGNVSPVAEANITGDPVAADRVFQAGFPVTIVGLDVTEEVVMDEDYFLTLKEKAGDAGDFVYDISRHYLEFHRDTRGVFACPVHDSSAVAYLLRPDLYRTKASVVRVVTEGSAAGQTVRGDPDESWAVGGWENLPVCQVCVSVDSVGVLDLYRDTLCGASDA